MDFDGLLKTVSNEWRVIGSAPLSFTVSIALLGFLLWRLIDWHYQGSLRTSEDRLKLRDDEISQLSRLLARETARSDLQSPPTDKIVDIILPEEARSIPTARSELPWQTTTPVEKRKFLPPERTVNSLLDMLDGVTSSQAETVSEPYIGRWINVTQVVADVDRREDHFVVLAFATDRPGRFVWMHFKPDIDLSTLHQGDTLTATGRIEELRFGNLRMYECEIIQSA